MTDPAVVLLILTVVAWVTLEGWKIARGEPTISEETWRFAAYYPPARMLVGLVVGLLLGHLFWQG